MMGCLRFMGSGIHGLGLNPPGLGFRNYAKVIRLPSYRVEPTLGRPDPRLQTVKPKPTP